VRTCEVSRPDVVQRKWTRVITRPSFRHHRPSTVRGSVRLSDSRPTPKSFLLAVTGFKKLPYCERLRKLKLITLKYRRLRRDMIEVHKILTSQNDANVSLKLILNQTKSTRGHDYKRLNNSFHYDIRKYSFSCRVVNVRNSLPQRVVEASNTNILVWINFGLIRL